jgi:predicted nucleic acid-binding protein
MELNNGFVVDATVGVSWGALSQSSLTSGQLLREVAAGVPFVVPGLWMYEVSNALLVLMRRKKIEPGQCARAREALGNLNPVIDDEGPRRALNRIWELANQHSLTVYDAVYLELAQRRKLPLASRDEALIEAARQCGVQTIL